MESHLQENITEVIIFFISYILLLFIFIFTTIRRFNKIQGDEIFLAICILVPVSGLFAMFYKFWIVAFIVIGILYSLAKFFIWLSHLILRTKKLSLILGNKKEN